MAGLDIVDKGKISYSCRESNPSLQTVAYCFTDWAAGIYMKHGASNS
jgi:hypothetical protein